MTTPITTDTVRRALENCFGSGDWDNDGGCSGWKRLGVDEHCRDDPQFSTDTCLEMLHARKRGLVFVTEGWFVPRWPNDTDTPTSGQPFRDAVIRLCAGEEIK